MRQLQDSLQDHPHHMHGLGQGAGRAKQRDSGCLSEGSGPAPAEAPSALLRSSPPVRRDANPFNVHKTQAKAGQSPVDEKSVSGQEQKQKANKHRTTSTAQNWLQKQTRGTAGRQRAGAGGLVPDPLSTGQPCGLEQAAWLLWAPGS